MNYLNKINNKKLIEKIISSNNQTIYVLKGFSDLNFDNFSLEKLLSIDSLNIFDTIDTDDRNIVDELLNKLKSNKPFVISFEGFCAYVNQLSNLISIFNYHIVIINNSLYHNFYPAPSFLNINLKKEILSSKDNVLNKVYNDYLFVDNQLFIEYVGLETNTSTIEYDEVDIINPSKYDKTFIEYSGNSLLFLGHNEESYIHFLNKVLTREDSNLYISFEKKDLLFYQKKLLGILSELGFKINFVKKSVKEKKDSNFSIYEEILQRKNKSFTFKNIQFYKNPGFSLETIEISQAEIIGALTDNALKANKGNDYNDIFVTAPTGSGKSILFQIPSIYLAEKYNLFTIVITPLIGLMNDQIQNIQSMTACAATINSEYTPEEKNKIKERIINKEISILYISPETLLSNNPISNLIGDRKIGLFVIDESHIVSTWGKSFRPDYWFLGDYISRLRGKQGYNFPIATFSATVTYGGNDDMHGDIIDSLNMKTGQFEYIAPMRRDDIHFDISVKTDYADYLKEKEDTVIDSLTTLIKQGTKTIVYFPYTAHVEKFYKALSNIGNVVKYHGKMLKFEKDDSIIQFKNNQSKMVLATKAFGMGIDINDVEIVYHYAPTGNLCDYVQEIGRAARSDDIQGIAKTDFFSNDYRYIKQLFGMSSIKNYQIVEILKKIRELYLSKKKRNFTISPDEFSYIFPNAYSMQDVETSFKTIMLMIQKDFEKDSTLNFKPVIFRPRSLFTRCYFMIKDEDIKEVKRSKYFKYFHLFSTADDLSSKYTINNHYNTYNKYTEEVTNRSSKTKVIIKHQGDIYSLDMKSMWEENYSDLSFASFKHSFFEGELPDFKIAKNLIQEYLLTIETRTKTFGELINIIEDLFKKVINEFSKPSISNSHLTIDNIADIFQNNSTIKLNKYESMIVAENFVELINKFQTKNLFNSGYVFRLNQATEKYSIHSINLLNVRIKSLLEFLKNKFSNVYNTNKKVFLLKSKDYRKPEDSKELMMAQILEIFKLATYQVISGERPEYFIRVNSISRIEGIINDEFYKSKMVELVQFRHLQSIKIMDEFFLKLSNDKDRWDFIEKYFSGFIE